MADDLAALRQYGTFQDEEEMRWEVAARVVASSSRAAIEDEAKLAQAYRDLEKAEHRARELEMELEDAQYAAAQESTVLPSSSSSAAPRAEGPSSSDAAVRRVSDVKYQLHAAQAELKRCDAVVRRTQEEVDRRQAARLAEAKRKEKEQTAADQLLAATPRSAAPAAVAVSSAAAAHSVDNGSNSARQAANGSAKGPSQAPSASHAGDNKNNGGRSSSSSSHRGINGSASPASPTTTKRVLYRVPTHLRGITQSDYSGGEVLPSLSRVAVTRADIRSKQRRYQDDSDMTHYLERIIKRQRLEAVANQQRRIAATTATARTASAASLSAVASVQPSASALAAVGSTKGKSENVAGADGDRGSTMHEQARVKQEPGTESAANNDSIISRGVKRAEATKSLTKEDEDAAEENGNSIQQHQIKVEEEKAGGTADEADENAIIDVDALMEDEDDAAVEAAVHRAAAQLHQERSGTVTPRSRSLSQAPAQPNLPSPSTHADGDDDLVVEMEEVTLLPGVNMDANIYNRLLDYQQEGLLWLLSLHARRAGGILGDEMGLGKTIQVAALLNALHHSRMLRGPVLVVSPMTVLRQWLAELHRWAPYMRSCVMHESSGGESTRTALLRSVQGTPAVVVTTFAAMREHCALLQRTGFQYIILDEGHKISNPDAGVTLAAKSFTTPHRLILSGSPIQNSLKELWCLFDFVQPGLLGTMNRFIDEFETPISQSRNVRASPLALATAVECAKTLQDHIAPYLLRRLKRQVNTQLPPKYERVLRVPLTDQQLEQYLQVLSSPVVQRLFAQTVMYGSRTGGLDRDGRDSTGSLHVAGARLNMTANRRNNSGVRLESFRLMNQLRQICNHADIYAVQRGADAEDRMLLHRSRGPLRPGQHRSFRSNNPVNLLGSGKLNALLMMLKEWKAFGHRVLVFSQTRMMLDIIENMCEQQSYTYIRMDGATNGHHRQELMDRFNEDDSIFVALLTTRVGGIGVNLIGADRVVIFDPDWNPITDVQARERAWRIGQRREVCVYRLITSGSVEEAILRRQLAKMYVTDKVLNDPELQRFFHVQDSFMENFLLGSEYEPRVPMDKKYLLTAHHLHNSTAAVPSAASRQPPVVDETLGDYGAVVSDGEGEDSSSSSSRSSVSCTEDEVVEDSSDGDGGASAPRRGRRHKKARHERDFGMLVPVKDEGDDDGHHGARGGPAADPRSGAASTRAKGKEWRETQLLQDLVDQQDVIVAGKDRVVQRLARRKAESMMQRVSSRVSVMVTMKEQQKKFSLLNALEEKKAKEAVERDEKRQAYREEVAAAAAKRRRE
ncbi:putative SNF2 family helicase-like protein putativeDNA excision repair protein [Leptomonas pyrrhocoris]|uniref:Putative SNF2 family helicase-like protein putativeDNA excision repair protein n=1 Tax=Leptomonas pyrrhocoris TaxID=157538 RepID=A0A0M9FWA1_LEPPY|nr:putative SNF2 family helicase-like protein putativeDNA excision repair protein [Leptomonas pyrrhocoris]KPA77269.1 putative SNF2 family helicase-like protein putativeDNA excision repair protein [Leptomonas pyrrhocoris]|eukprot:XP_015655708.1 putative SNF2 family helicase-like protein putativeDNA excision repair protein [Leptomonas pyrrhocoris]